MSIQLTLAIIKPDAMESRRQGEILQRVLAEGFDVVAMRQVHLTRRQAEGFYAIHREKPFFEELCRFMTRGPVVVMALQRDDAVAHWRRVIGSTNPANADEGTIRKRFGISVTENATHGSDSEENGRLECGYFFPRQDLL
jgi:nucleoside-diphosphate kinase